MQSRDIINPVLVEVAVYLLNEYRLTKSLIFFIKDLQRLYEKILTLLLIVTVVSLDPMSTWNQRSELAELVLVRFETLNTLCR